MTATRLHDTHFFFALKTKKKLMAHAMSVSAHSIGQLLNPQLWEKLSDEARSANTAAVMERNISIFFWPTFKMGHGRLEPLAGAFSSYRLFHFRERLCKSVNLH